MELVRAQSQLFLFNISEINNFVFAKYNSYFVLKIVHIELGGGVERERWGIWGNVGEDAGQFYMFCLPRVQIPPGTIFYLNYNLKFFLSNITSYRFCLITSNKNWRSDKVYVTFGIGHMYMSPLSQLLLV